MRGIEIDCCRVAERHCGRLEERVALVKATGQDKHEQGKVLRYRNASIHRI